MGYTIKNVSYISFVEVELSNKPDIKKYERLFMSREYEGIFDGVFPLIIYITNKRIPDTFLEVVQIDEEIKNISKLI